MKPSIKIMSTLGEELACDPMNGKSSEVFELTTSTRLNTAAGVGNFNKPQHMNNLTPQMPSAKQLEGSRFHIRSSRRNVEDFTFDEQFMLDAITEHYRNQKRHISAKKIVYRFLNFPSTIAAYLYHIFT